MYLKNNSEGFADISVLMTLVVVGSVMNVALLVPMPHPVWCMACVMATTYRVFRIARA
jgi:hypothetical protein